MGALVFVLMIYNQCVMNPGRIIGVVTLVFETELLSLLMAI